VNPSHAKRLATTAVLLPLLAVCIAVRGWCELVMLGALAGVGLWEFYGLFWGRERTGLKMLGVAAALALLWLSGHGGGWHVLGLVIAAQWVANLGFLGRSGRGAGVGGRVARKPAVDGVPPAAGGAKTGETAEDQNPGSAAEGMAGGQEPGGRPSSEAPGVFVAGLLYVPVLLQFVLHMRSIEIVLVLAAVIASDVGAYYAGTTFGGPKLWPAVSPKKTWSGSLGGFAAAIAVCLAMSGVDEYALSGAGAGRPWWMWALLGAGLNVAAQVGDLFESALKRDRGIKDSGHILPGHGGVLDRIDSLLLAIPVYAGLDAVFGFFAK